MPNCLSCPCFLCLYHLGSGPSKCQGSLGGHPSPIASSMSAFLSVFFVRLFLVCCTGIPVHVFCVCMTWFRSKSAARASLRHRHQLQDALIIVTSISIMSIISSIMVDFNFPNKGTALPAAPGLSRKVGTTKRQSHGRVLAAGVFNVHTNAEGI